jgi:hypothetical protein
MVHFNGIKEANPSTVLKSMWIPWIIASSFVLFSSVLLPVATENQWLKAAFLFNVVLGFLDSSYNDESG